METSSAETGSSQTINLGLMANAAGNADPLALAAGEFMRIAAGVFAVEADQIPAILQCAHAFTLRLAKMMDIQRFAYDIRNRHAGFSEEYGS